MDYRSAYYHMFGVVTKARDELVEGHVMEAWALLSQEANAIEDVFLDSEEPPEDT